MGDDKTNLGNYTNLSEGMKGCLVSSLMVSALQATHLLRLFHNNNQNLLPGSTRGSLFTVNNYFGPNSGNTNNNGGGGGGGSVEGSYNGQIASGGNNNGVTRQVSK